MKKTVFAASLVLAICSLSTTSANATVVQSVDFSSPILIGPTPSPGVWYTDRFAPNAFYTSGGVLIETISSADSASSRSSGYGSTFYNTQGRKYDVLPNVTAMSIDLFVDSRWIPMNQRIAGLWGTAFNDISVTTSFAILEFASDGTGARFQGWNNGSWMNFGLPIAFAYDTMHNLSIALDGTQWNYSLDGNFLGSVSANGSTHIENVILEGINNYGANTVASHDILWDNFVATDGSTVPEPGTLPLALSAFVVGGFMTRRRKT